MKKFIRTLTVLMLIALLTVTACSCLDETTTNGSKADINNTMDAANTLQANQPTPTDIEYSLERYNLIRRAYWVNGQREKANALPCEIEKPLGYIVLFSGNATVGSFVVDGKVSSLNSFLTPESEYYEKIVTSASGDETALYSDQRQNKWLADVDGSYGENDSGIFFFTPDGKYIEWSGDYLYSDIPFTVKDPVVNYEVAK